MLSDQQHKQPLVALPDGSRPVVNKAGTYVVLNFFAATKLKYWTIYEAPNGEIRVRFNTKHNEPLGQFGAYTVVHIRPVPSPLQPEKPVAG